ncbi:MAG: hypothetical protein WBA76_01895 [Phormidesmis sp.]
MKSTNMELQAIREKLQMLQAEPLAAESLALPWAEKPQYEKPRAERPRSEKPQNEKKAVPPRSVGAESAYSPQELAIEALKQRSSNVASGESRSSHSPPSTEIDARTDALVAKELYRLEVLASNINERSQQQAAEIMTLKRSAQQASVALRRQGVHEHPQLEAITQFLNSYPSAIVPYVQRDATGRFTLTYNTIDFHQAEQDAVDTASALRKLARPDQVSSVQIPFSQPTRPVAAKDQTVGHPATKSRYASAEHSIQTAATTVVHGFTRLLSQTVKPLVGLYAERAYQSDRVADSFSWLDGMIWFSGAAIARLAISGIALSYPIVQSISLVALAGILVFALYQVIVPKSDDYSLIYRLCMAMVGLLVAGMF